MKPALQIAVLLLLAVPAQAGPDSLAPYTWKNRLILVFAARSDDPRIAEQKEIARQHQAGFEDRDLLVLDYAPGEGEELRERLGIPDDRYQAVLIGKDGTEKLRKEKPLTSEDLFPLIDAMPMRRREMRRR